MNPETGDTAFVKELTIEGGDPAATLNSAAIIKGYDVFSNVFASISNIGRANGGDRIDTWQLSSNTSWILLNPLRGEIQPGETQDFQFSLNPVGFPSGRYQGQLVFAHNARNNTDTVPITLNVRPSFLAPEPIAIPAGFGISEVHPNPFNSAVTLRYHLTHAGPTQLAIYDLAGREVTRLVDKDCMVGAYSVTIDAGAWASGVYMAKLTSAGVSSSAKLVLIK
jgi:hypothetical protein